MRTLLSLALLALTSLPAAAQDIEAQVAAQAEAYKASVGQPLGGGVSLRDAVAEGKTLRLDATFAEVAPDKVDVLAKALRDQINAAYCAGGSSAFYDAGGALQIRAFDAAGAMLTDTTINSCDP